MNEYNNQLFVIDKSAGPTSFDVVSAFRRASKLRKVGHTGTLDPLARGVLLLCTGVATRAVEHFMNLEKEYRFDVCLGRETDTLDTEGTIVREAPCPRIDSETIGDVADSFVGDYDLVPPAFSALKKGGRRMYELARAGETPEPESRRVKIYGFRVVEVRLPEITCEVRCSRGTYVRSLARDFGEKLGVPAHIDNIVRTRIGPFERGAGFPSDRLFEKDVEGIEGYEMARALDFLPAAVLGEKACRGLRFGTLPETREVIRTTADLRGGGPVRLLDESGALLALGHRNPGRRRNPLQLVDSYRLLTDNPAGKGSQTTC
jgi:tRNA pseudouridine55 synthase